MARRRQMDKKVAANVLRLAKEKKKTIGWLAREAKMSRQLLDYKLMEGRFFASDIEELANALEVSTYDIMGG